LTKVAVINGIIHSITTSILMRIGVIMDNFLYSLTLRANFFKVSIPFISPSHKKRVLFISHKDAINILAV